MFEKYTNASVGDFLGPIYILIIYFIAQKIIQNNKENILFQKYYTKGLLYRLFGSLGFYCVYVFYYGGGDSTSFFDGSKAVSSYIMSFPIQGLGVLFSTPKSSIDFPPELYNTLNYVYSLTNYIAAPSSWEVARIGAVINLICFDSFLCTGLIMAFFAYHVSFKLFTAFVKLYPDKEKQLFFSFCQVPSVFFWGSHLNKDTVCISLICIFLYCIIQVFKERKIKPYYFIVIIYAITTVLTIRSYVFMAILPGLSVWIIGFFQEKIQSGFIKTLITPLLFIGSMSIAYFAYSYLTSSVSDFNLDSMKTKAEGFQGWHETLQETVGGSGYHIEGMDYSTAAIIQHIPEALAICLFGPFPWQVKNFVMLLSSLEGVFFFYLLLKVVFNPVALTRFYKIIYDPPLFFCFSFVFILAIAIALTSFNYGALVRYKIPVMPFFSTLLYVLLPSKSSSK